MRRAEAKARFLGVCNYKPSLPPAYWGTSDPSKSVAWEFGYRTMQTGESARLPSPVLSIHGEREDPHARTQRRRRRGRLGVGETQAVRAAVLHPGAEPGTAALPRASVPPPLQVPGPVRSPSRGIGPGLGRGPGPAV